MGKRDGHSWLLLFKERTWTPGGNCSSSVLSHSILLPKSNTRPATQPEWCKLLITVIGRREKMRCPGKHEKRAGSLQRRMRSLTLSAWYVSMSVLGKPCVTSGIESRNCDRWLATSVLRESQSLAIALLGYSGLSCVIQPLWEWLVNLLGLCCLVAADSSHCQMPSSGIKLAVPRWQSHQLLCCPWFTQPPKAVHSSRACNNTHHHVLMSTVPGIQRL